MPISGPPAPIWCEITSMAMAHPRRYFSLSAAGAIAMRFPPTSSRMYTSSVSDPLANTSNTSSAASRVVSGRVSIISSTASRGSRVMSTLLGRQAYPTRARRGKARAAPRAGRRRAPPGRRRPALAEPPRRRRRRRGHPRDWEAIEAPGERVGGPRSRRDDRDARGTRRDRRDAREEGVHLGPWDEERDRAGDVVAVRRGGKPPTRDACALDEELGQVAELRHPGRAPGALAAHAVRAVPAMESQELHAHLHAAAQLGQGRADARPVRLEPVGELRGRHDGAEAEREDGGRIERGADDVVVAPEGARVGVGRPVTGARDQLELVHGVRGDGAEGGRGRAPERRQALDDGEQVLVHRPALSAPTGAPNRGERSRAWSRAYGRGDAASSAMT